MPVFIAMIIGGLIQAAGSIVGRVLISLGIGFVAYEGISAGLDSLKAQAMSHLSVLPAALLGVLGVLKVGTAINIVFAAYTARLILAGMMSGTVRRMVFGVGDIRRAGG